MSANIVFNSILKNTVKYIYNSFIDSLVLLSKVLHFKNKSSFGHCWHKVCFIFICKQKYNIWYFVFCMRIVCILKRWQAYLQKWFLNACGYFWFITWWHVKKSSKKTFSSFVCSKKSKILYITIRANASPYKFKLLFIFATKWINSFMDIKKWMKSRIEIKVMKSKMNVRVLIPYKRLCNFSNLFFSKINYITK